MNSYGSYSCRCRDQFRRNRQTQKCERKFLTKHLLKTFIDLFCCQARSLWPNADLCIDIKLTGKIWFRKYFLSVSVRREAEFTIRFVFQQFIKKEGHAQCIYLCYSSFCVTILSVFSLVGIDPCTYKPCPVGYRCEVVDQKNADCKGWCYRKIPRTAWQLVRLLLLYYSNGLDNSRQVTTFKK